MTVLVTNDLGFLVFAEFLHIYRSFESSDGSCYSLLIIDNEEKTNLIISLKMLILGVPFFLPTCVVPVILLYHKKDIAIPPSFVKYSSDLIFRTSLRMLMLIFKNQKSWSWSWFGINCIEGGFLVFWGDVIVLRLQQDDLLSITCFKRRHTCTQHSCFFFFFF